MSNYGTYVKTRFESKKNFFFGEGNYKEESNKYLTFNHYVNDDEIVICTNNITWYVKNGAQQYLLIVGNNKAVYLKDWQLEASNLRNGLDTYLVKLNRKYFKTYTFKKDFENFYFENDQDFDYLVELAKEQDQMGMAVRFHH